MRGTLLVCLLFSLSLPAARAQRNAPVSESYLAGVSIYHQDDRHLGLDVIFRKDIGPPEHTEHQMYLIAYLEKDEDKILELAGDASLLDKSQPRKGLLLDVLRDKRLITVLGSKVAQRTAYESGTRYGKAKLSEGAFPFHFCFRDKEVFGAINTLENFDPENVIHSDGLYYKDRFKWLVFVPVNDSPYADKVSPEVRGKFDFANWSADRLAPSDQLFRVKTILLYFQPLPYNFSFRKTKDGQMDVFIN
jgi:hypothetical protein